VFLHDGRLPILFDQGAIEASDRSIEEVFHG
jgi:hypothetical protein